MPTAIKSSKQKTYIAVLPINIAFDKVIGMVAKGSKKTADKDTALLTANAGEGLTEFVSVIGEGDYQAFIDSLAKGKLAVEGNKATYTRR